MGVARTSAIGNLLKRYRLAAGLTQEQLAERSGLSARAVSDIERGLKPRPRRETILLLVDALALEPSARAALIAAAGRPGEPRVPDSLHPVAPSIEAGPARRRTLSNLPVALTSFVGREPELRDVKRLLGTTRLLTITGAGGCGKSRLALRVATDLEPEYPDGVWLVELAALDDPGLVAQTIGGVLGVLESATEPMLVVLGRFLRSKQLLLVLDNCEHLLDTCASIANALVRDCSGLTVLATSREALRVAGEVTRRIPSLPVPPETTSAVAQIATFDAVRLFVDRTVATQPTFGLSERNGAAVVRICRQLDGIPLAIELASARLTALSIDQLATRLDRRFRLLTGGSRTALPRQQTLQNTIDWSYDLLAPEEQELFRKLGVFAGGWTLEAAEALGGESALDLLTALVDKSLVLVEVGSTQAPRYRLMETLREYAREKLATNGEAETARALHAAYYARLAEEVDSKVRQGREKSHRTRLDPEADNLRATLHWYFETGDVASGLALIVSLRLYWWFRGALRDAQDWFERFLSLPVRDEDARLRAQALIVECYLPFVQENPAKVRAILEEASSIGQAHHDRRIVTGASITRVIMFHEPDMLATLADYRREHGEPTDQWATVGLMLNAGRLLNTHGEVAAARACVEDALAIARRLGLSQPTAFALEVLGEMASTDQEAEAREYLVQSLGVYRDRSDLIGITSVEYLLGRVEVLHGHYAAASEHFRTCLRLARDSTWLLRIIQSFDGLACVAAGRGLAERAFRLAGVSDRLRATSGIPGSPVSRSALQRAQSELEVALSAIRESIDAATIDAARATGQAMPIEQAVAYALEDSDG